jgi:hypothetical protein
VADVVSALRDCDEVTIVDESPRMILVDAPRPATLHGVAPGWLIVQERSYGLPERVTGEAAAKSSAAEVETVRYLKAKG